MFGFDTKIFQIIFSAFKKKGENQMKMYTIMLKLVAF